MLNYLIQYFNQLPITDSTLRKHLQLYLDQQLSYCHDEKFSALFPWKELKLSQDYFLQKLITVNGEQYLTGPRFYGMNIQRPFIEIIAGSAPIDSSVAKEIVKHWSYLNTEKLRITRRIDEPTIGEHDQYIYISTMSGMKNPSNSACQVRRAMPNDLAWCMDAIKKSFEYTFTYFPELSDRVTPCDQEEMKEGIDQNEVYLIESDGEDAGLIYLSQSVHNFLHGYLIMEEVVLPHSRGKGLASEAQRIIADKLAIQDPHALFLGTINARNQASIHTATNAGRKPFLRYEFVTPGDFSN